MPTTTRAAHARPLRPLRALAASLCLPLAAALSPAPAHADTIYLCKAYSGGTFWTNGQCSQKRALIDRIVSVPTGMPFEQQVELGNQSVREAQRLTAPPQQTVQTVTHTYGPDKATECRLLNEQVTHYEAMARQPQSGQMQDWISQQKKEARDRQWRLRC